jgi:hypothetical protein
MQPPEPLVTIDMGKFIVNIHMTLNKFKKNSYDQQSIGGSSINCLEKSRESSAFI